MLPSISVVVLYTLYIKRLKQFQ